MERISEGLAELLNEALLEMWARGYDHASIVSELAVGLIERADCPDAVAQAAAERFIRKHVN